MEYKKIDDKHYVIRIDKGEEVLSKITELCKNLDIKCGSVVGLGAASYVKIGLFNTIEKKYHSKEYSGPMEITSLIGNISRMDNEVYLHFHINLCDDAMNVIGGHLNECIIGTTCELVLTELDGNVNREFNQEIGLNLFKFD